MKSADDRRFPFFAATPADKPIVARRIAEVIQQHRGVIVNAVRRYLPPGDPDFPDAMQDVTVRLLEKLPDFNVTKGGLRGYVFMVANCAAATFAARRGRHRDRERAVPAAEPHESGPAGSLDRAAHALVETPERWLTARQAEVLRECRRSHAEPRRAVAARLGYRTHSGLSNAMRRIAERLRELDPVDLATES